MNDLSKIDRLPKWAIEYINGLNRNIADLTKHVRELSEPESIEWTDTVVCNYTQPDVRLPRGSMIRFDVDGNIIDVMVRGELLEVRAYNGTLSIYPRVSNVIEVTVRDR